MKKALAEQDYVSGTGVITCWSNSENGTTNIKYFGTDDKEHVIYGSVLIDNRTMQPKQKETINIGDIEITLDVCWLETKIFAIEQDFAGKHGLKEYIQTRRKLAHEINTRLMEQGIVPDGLEWNYDQ